MNVATALAARQTFSVFTVKVHLPLELEDTMSFGTPTNALGVKLSPSIVTAQ